MAGNQVGKSQTGAALAAMHATGLYQDWYTGYRFNRPTHGWICGASGQAIRDIAQTKLFGTPNDPSSIGMVAPLLIKGKSASHGTADLYDTIRIEHVSGGVSTISTKSYSQDVSTWMGSTLDWIWIDEECPETHYAEAIARLRGDGIIWLTFTPLAGYSNVVSRFLRDDSEDALKDRGVVRMGLKHALHFSEEERRQRLASYPTHERAARENGDPTLGSGAIYTQLESTLAFDPHIVVPLHWSKLWAIDFGHAVFAAVLLAWDKDNDVLYILDCVRLENSRPIEHAAAIRRIAPDIRVAWPHDGHQHERGAGGTVVSNYRPHGLLLLGTHATFPDGSMSVEAGILEIQERMADGRFRVSARLRDWYDEMRGYHRDINGKIVKQRDHLLDATRYAVMMKRYAKPGPIGNSGMGMSARRQPQPSLAVNTDFDLFA